MAWGLKIELDTATREALVRALRLYLKDELDIEIGGVEAMQLLDFTSQTLGPHLYNQALRDARTRLHARLEALDETFYELEKPAKG